MFVETFLGLCNHPLGGQPDHRGGPQTLRPASGKTYCCGPIEEQVSSARGGCLPLGEELGFLLARGLLFLPLLKGLLGIEAVDMLSPLLPNSLIGRLGGTVSSLRMLDKWVGNMTELYLCYQRQVGVTAHPGGRAAACPVPRSSLAPPRLAMTLPCYCNL